MAATSLQLFMMFSPVAREMLRRLILALERDLALLTNCHQLVFLTGVDLHAREEHESHVSRPAGPVSTSVSVKFPVSGDQSLGSLEADSGKEGFAFLQVGQAVDVA